MRYLITLFLVSAMAYASDPEFVTLKNGAVVTVPDGLSGCEYHPNYCKKGYDPLTGEFPFIAIREKADAIIAEQIAEGIELECGSGLPFCGDLHPSPQKCVEKCDTGELVISPQTCNP